MSMLESYWKQRVITAAIASACLAGSSSCLPDQTEYCAEGLRCPAGMRCETNPEGTEDQPVCVRTRCGNGIKDPGEVCDDGNRQSGDECSADCMSDETCGNGITDFERGERCDCAAPPEATSATGTAAIPTECLGRANNDQGGMCTTSCQLHCGNQELSHDELCEGSMVKTGYRCTDFGYDHGHMRCLPGCAGLDQSDCVAFDWRTMATPTPMSIDDVWGSGSDDVYAVGANGTLLHYDGYNWDIQDPRTNQRLRGIWGADAQNVYAVGDAGTIVHHDGTDWQPVVSGTTENLFEIWGTKINDTSHDIFVVGESGTILRANGDGWQAMPSIPVDTTLRAVWGTSSNNVFAVGSAGEILHYDGDIWRRSLHNNGPSVVKWRGVWGSNREHVYVVGDDNGDSRLMFYDGHDWSSPADTPATGRLNAIWGTEENNIFVAADDGVILHHDGDSWEQTQLPITGRVMSIWGANPEVFAAGEDGVINHLGRVTWQRIDTDIHDLVRDIWAVNNDDVFLVGHDGLIRHYNGENWRSFAPTPDEHKNLYGVWGSAANDVWSVGEGGTILHYDGTEWTSWAEGECPSPTSKDLYGLWGRDADSMFAVGADGTILQYEDGSWHTIDSPTFESLFAIWGDRDSGDIWAAGNNGTLLHFDGETWRAKHGFASENLYQIWGTKRDGVVHVFVVGDNREVLHWNGEQWSRIPILPPSDWIRGVWGTGPDDVFVVGENGMVQHHDGSSWTWLQSGEVNHFYTVWASRNDDNVFVAGSNGRVYELRRNGAGKPAINHCGNGILEYGEQCDDGLENGAPTSGGGCDLDCRVRTWCGDGVLQTGEACDDGFDNSNDVAGHCREDCTVTLTPIQDANTPYDHNVIVQATFDTNETHLYVIQNNEARARTVQLDTYNADWPLGASCRSSVDTIVELSREPNEQPFLINDNRTIADYCSRVTYLLKPDERVYARVSPRPRTGATLASSYYLRIEFTSTCGDGVVTGQETCESANDGECTADCERPTPICGDGIMEGSEQCDDNNTSSGDGCSDLCSLELDLATPIGGPDEVRCLTGSLDADDWLWARPDHACTPTTPADHHLDVFPIINQTGSPQRLTVTAIWQGDGHLHAFAHPFDPTSVSGCLIGDDSYETDGSQLEDLWIAQGETLYIVASPFGGNMMTIGDYTIDVYTKPVYNEPDQCVAHEPVCPDWPWGSR